RSLDDFVRRFHGAPSGPPSVKTYTFDDIVNTLNEVAPHDWRAFFEQRLWSTDAHAPLGGIERGGWRLNYDATRGQHVEDLEDGRERVEMGYSLGLRLNTGGLVADVLPGTAAASAGLGPGMTVVAVDGKAYTPDVLRDAVAASKSRKEPLQLLVNNEGALKTYALDYHGGERYPRLMRDASKPDLLTPTITPLTGASIGVAVCDEYMDKYESCINGKVPRASQPMLKDNMEAIRKTWREVAATPQGRAGLAQGCDQALAEAKVSLKSYGCAW
ncbi:MAG: hypothetical protein ACJ74T_13660, partial [Pyrinomonadaceae bacterium]